MPTEREKALFKELADASKFNPRASLPTGEDFDLESDALALAPKLIERIHRLEAQLRDLQTQFPRLRVRR